MRDDTTEFLSFLFVITMIVLFFSSIGFMVDYHQCKAKADMQQLQYSYGVMQGCMVREKGGKWIDYDRYRIMED